MQAVLKDSGLKVTHQRCKLLEFINQVDEQHLYHSALISDRSECIQRFLIKASLCSNGCSLSNSENAKQKSLGHSFKASFKRAYTALHDFEREQLFIQSFALFKPF